MSYVGARGTRFLGAQNTGRKTVFATNQIKGLLVGLFCARANVKVHAALALLIDTLTFGVMTTYSTFTMCLHTRQYLVVTYN